ncbi:cell wall-active antibiotics response protein LiaF [Saccharibacillus kuerlensis]|uniref:Cell wall-active antibiotics response protein n=1 Tax=Saccharibacillus kuerlensis TaxID=459527 RepID=A0ABQ2KSS0_9BACL|nr:cell wall-active antibiotics response protein LiaF [Saccharibacillus kuerlensis]GGN92255.1 hypothetical protein GCM10010969_04570 [Saccharibacillus kuerlensis]
MKKSGALWLIAIGGFFLAYQLGYISYSIGDLIRTFWPMILILVGLQQLMGMKKHSSSAVGNLILVAIGGYFQARNLGMIMLSPGEFFKFLIPAGLIATGIYVLVKPRKSPGYPSAERELPEEFYGKDGSVRNRPPGPPMPPSPIEPLESPLDRMFVDLDKTDAEKEKNRTRAAAQEGGSEKMESDARHAFGSDSKNGAEFQKIGSMAREIGKQTADQVRKIDFSRIADEVKNEVGSAMNDFRSSMKQEDGKRHKSRKNGISLEKDYFEEEFSERGRFYDSCDEDSRYGFGSYDREEMRKAREKADKGKKEKTVNESSFIGDYYIGKDYFRLKPLNVSHFIGDTVIDLTKAQIPYGTTKIDVSCFIGDIVIYMPNDPEVGVKVQSSSFIGDHNVLGHTRGGMGSGVNETYNYEDCAKRIKISVSSFIADINVNIVG